MIYEPHIECASPEQLKALQAAHLRTYLKTVAPRIPEYQERITAANLDSPDASIGDEELLDRFSAVGFTDAGTYVAIDADARREIDRRLYYLETTSGTTSLPKSRYATYEDDLLDQHLVARSFATFEVTPRDRVLTVDLGELNFYALMTKGMAKLGIYDSLFYSARKPFGRSMREALASRPDVLLTVPSVLMRSFNSFVESLKEAPCVKKLIYYAEPLDSSIQEYLYQELGIECFSLYSSIELGMIGAECTVHNGVHVWADSLLLALKDAVPVKRTNLRSGVEESVLQGSLGVTTLRHMGKPTLAYLLGDKVQYTNEPCACGRTLPRLYFVERDSESFSIFGIKFTHREIYDHVYKNESVTNFLQIVLADEGSVTLMKLILPEESLHSIQHRQAELMNGLEAKTSISFLLDHGVLRLDVEFVPAEFFTRRKIRLIEDQRDESAIISEEEENDDDDDEARDEDDAAEEIDDLSGVGQDEEQFEPEENDAEQQ
jgi:phenylacetate-CoA ligase